MQSCSGAKALISFCRDVEELFECVAEVRNFVGGGGWGVGQGGERAHWFGDVLGGRVWGGVRSGKSGA